MHLTQLANLGEFIGSAQVLEIKMYRPRPRDTRR